MVLRLDETVGKVLDELDRLQLTEKTLVIFASDNGHTASYYECPGRTQKHSTLDGRPVDNRDNPFRTETCGDIFNGNDGMAGDKFSNWDGGNRIVFLASWPGVIEEGSVSDHLISNYDTLATVAEIAGSPIPENTDGISFLPVLRGDADAPEHDHVVFSSPTGPALVTKEGWKLRLHIPMEALRDAIGEWHSLAFDDRVAFQLFDLIDDYAEKNDLAAERPEIAERLKRKLMEECDGNFYNGTPMAHHAKLWYKTPDWDEIVRGVI